MVGKTPLPGHSGASVGAQQYRTAVLLEQTMSAPDENKRIARQFIEEVFVRGRSAAVDGLVTPDFVSHGLPGSGPAVMKAAIGRVAPALSDVKMTIHDVVAEGDRVAVRLTS